MDRNEQITKLNKARGSINKIVEDLSTVANAKELENQDLLRLVLKRMGWDLDNASGQVHAVWDDLNYMTTSGALENLRQQLDHANTRIKDLQVRLEKYEPTNKLTQEEIDVGKTNKINAIKMVRARTGMGLKEAKDLVETVYPPGYVYPVNVPF